MRRLARSTWNARLWAVIALLLIGAVAVGSVPSVAIEPPAVSLQPDPLSSVEVKPRETRELRLDAPRTPQGQEAVLVLKARLASGRPAGYTHAMRLTLGGKTLDVKRLLNKKPMEERVDGNIQSMAAAGGDILVVGYAPDFTSPDTHPNYAFKRAKVCDFELVVTDLLKEDTNTLNCSRLVHGGKTITELRIAEGWSATIVRKRG